MEKIRQTFLVLIIFTLVQTNSQSTELIQSKWNNNGLIPENGTNKDYSNQYFFSSTFDTLFVDTIWNQEHFLIIKSISDSLYNSIYNKSRDFTQVIEVPYDYKDSNWDITEKERIDNAKGLAYRMHDTLILGLERGGIKLVDCKGCDVGYSYHYVDFLSDIDCHLIFTSTEWGGLSLYSRKYGRIDTRIDRKMFANSLMTQLIFCNIQGNGLDGGWFNYLKWVEIKNGEPFKVLFDFDPKPYDSATKIWGFRDPIWITDNSLICKYVVIRLINYSFIEEYCFVKLQLRKANS